METLSHPAKMINNDTGSAHAEILSAKESVPFIKDFPNSEFLVLYSLLQAEVKSALQKGCKTPDSCVENVILAI